MAANTTTITGTSVHIALNATHDAVWDWNTAVGQWDAIVSSIQVNPATANVDMNIRDGSATGVPFITFNMTDADDNRVKYFARGGTGKRCRPYIKVVASADCVNTGSATIMIELI